MSIVIGMYCNDLLFERWKEAGWCSLYVSTWFRMHKTNDSSIDPSWIVTQHILTAEIEQQHPTQQHKQNRRHTQNQNGD